ncbi:MAG TPA: metalloregulator ArsR/SmtB family transcription factor [Polyangiaceae bacterium]
MNLTAQVDTLTLLGDESRIRLCALLTERELTVTDLVRVTGISQSRVSTHLARLRDAGFVRDRKDGPRSFYALAKDALPRAAKTVLEEAAQSADPTLEGDLRRLSDLDAERRGALPASFASELERQYSPGRTWQSLAVGLAALLDLGDVLDVGCGPGAAAALLAPQCRSLTCIDTDARMIEAAEERLADHANAKVTLADAHALPFKPASFDAVLLFHTLTYAEKPQRVLDECARVLRPGGRLVALTLDAHEHRDVTAPYGERHSGFSPRTLKNMLARAGLDVVTSEVTCREAKKPHFAVVSSVARKPKPAPKKSKGS